MRDPSTQPADLAGWLAYLEILHPKAIAMGLDRVNQVKQRLELNPDFPIITVAGTNGKGSTCAMLESILTQAGYKVACYSSPHLLQYNERVRVAGSDASDADLCHAFAAVEEARGDVVLTYFEFGTLAAMWHFMQGKVDVAVLEVGLGGRLDAVNVFTPSAAIITCIDIDHIEFLGNTRTSIGFEKAGIYRTGVPAICGDVDAPESIPHQAQEIGADYRQLGVHFGFDEHGETWDFWSQSERISNLPKPSLVGHYQLNNAACALEALRSLPLNVDQPFIRAGLLKASLQGRFQKISDFPEVIVDVAHNPQAAQGLAQNLRNNSHLGRTIAVFAMLADKDMAGVVSMMQEEIDVWYVAGIQQGRGAGHEKLAQEVHKVLPQASLFSFATVAEAYMEACRSAHENDRIIIFGSFYTVADVLRASIN
ncbi:MAG TPA: bifunctional tetrahydrofolate synthase/dihydrofolate synthase [Methylophilaceae bacterium]|jgi:dihydrofolate synthase/folylpolyglutamate synthase